MKHLLTVICCAWLMLLPVACSKSEDSSKKPQLVPPSLVVNVNDDEQRTKFREEMQTHLKNGDFEALHKIARDLATTKERFPGGDWKLDRFFEAIGGAPGGPAAVKENVNYPERIAKLKEWTRQMPDSIYANIALGEAQIGHAWEIRGGGFAGTVTDKRFSDFQQELKNADDTLNKLKSRSTECVAWYAAKQSIGVGLGSDPAEMIRLREEATAVEPLYYDVYKEHALYLLPRWHGAPGDWEKFAHEASAKVGGVEGSILYSEICWQMSRYYPGGEFFKQNRLNWLRIKKGFTDRQTRYGTSIRYLNAFCLLAGAAGDKTTTKALMSRIGDRWERDFWIEKQYFDGYKKWAHQ